MIRYWARFVSWYSSTRTWRQRPRYQATRLGHVLEELHGLEEQVVEVDGADRAQALLVACA